ncbi:MAG: photosynthetic reaction center cytochrome c subunit [Bacteroidetes bacterium]|jgi:hypothetical protein|nr:photosynthetic reaction center cytochrome c subunit [Bacteroidota bacterium]
MRRHLLRNTTLALFLTPLLVLAWMGRTADAPGDDEAPVARAALPEGANALSSDSLAASRERHVTAFLERLGEQQNAPAGEVFDSLEYFQQVPAGRLLRIMNMGFGRSLGVGCEHCHDTDQWSSNAKRPKRVAREMIAMVRVINDSLLARIPALESERPVVNCTTCHRGDVKPALDLGAEQDG